MQLNRTIIKGMQLILTLLCLGFHTQSKTNDSCTEFVSITAFAGFLIIIVGYFVAGPSHVKVDIFYAIVGFAFFSAAAYLNLHKFYNAWGSDEKTFGLIKSGLALLNAALFLLESVVVWRGWTNNTTYFLPNFMYVCLLRKGNRLPQVFYPNLCS